MINLPDSAEFSRTIEHSFKASKYAGWVLLASLYLALWFLLVYSFEVFICPRFYELGFTYQFDGQRYATGFAAYLAFAFILSIFREKASHFFLHLHFLLPIAPMIVLYSVGGAPALMLFYTLILFALVCTLALIPVSKPSFLSGIERVGFVPLHWILYGALFAGIAYIAAIIYFGGAAYLNFNIWNVYNFRSEAAEILPKIFGYIRPTVAQAVIPLGIVISLYKKSWWLLAVFSAISILSFALTAHKTALVLPFIIIGFYGFLSLRPRFFMLVSVFIWVVIASLLSPYLGDSGGVFGIMSLRRIMFVPALLNNFYFDVFSVNDQFIWSNSKLTFGLIENPHVASAASIVGMMFINPLTHANTGWIGSGFSQLGFIGMSIYAVVLGVLIRFVDIVAQKRNVAFACALFLFPLVTIFISADLSGMFLTHGLLLLLTISILLRADPALPPNLQPE